VAETSSKVSARDLKKLGHRLETIAELEQRNDELHELLDALPSLAWTVGPDTECTYLNKPWIDYTGVPLESQLGHGWVEVVHPDDREATFQVFSTAFEAREAFEVEYRIKSAAGDYGWFLGRGRPHYSQDGRFRGYAGMTIDISERHARDEDRVQFTVDLEQLNHIAAHDFKEPVRTILSFSSMLREDLGNDLPPDAAESLGFVRSAAERLRVLVEAFSKLSRARRIDAKVADVDLSDCVRQVESALAAHIRSKEAVVTVGFLPEVSADRSMMVQLFQNLIANALKFSDGRSPRVAIGAVRSGDEWTVSVQDNGIGIEPRFAQKIFEPFQRLQATQDYEGAGMGLAFCQTVVERHRGRIWVDTDVDQGACFRFTLPAD